MTDLRPNQQTVVKARRHGPHPTVDVGRHLAQRRAVAALKTSQRVIVSTSTFGGQLGTRSRVLVAGVPYEVDNIRLEQLRSGFTPDDLDLKPISEDEE